MDFNNLLVSLNYPRSVRSGVHLRPGDEKDIGAGSAPQPADTGPDPLEEMWWLLPMRSLVRDPGSCLAPGEPLLQHLPSILPPAGLQGARELPSTADAGPAARLHGMFSTLGRSTSCCGGIRTSLVS